MKKDRVMLKRYLGMVLGVFIISIGIALFKESHLGNDPISALNMRLAEIFGISLGLQNLYANIIFLIVQILFGRKYIGAGTFVNGVLVGYVVSFFYGLLAKNFGLAEEQGLFIQILELLLMTIFRWDFGIKRKSIILPAECLPTDSVLWQPFLREVL